MTVSLRESNDTEALLRQLPLEMRTKAVPSALRAHTRQTVNRIRQRIPRGDPQHNPEKPPLWRTIKTVIRRYGDVTLAVVGAAWPEGAHFHLVDRDHRLVAWGRQTSAIVPGKNIMAPAIDETEESGRRAMIAKLKEWIEKAGG